MIRVELTTDEIDTLDEAIDDPELKKRYGKRLLALKMHALGVQNSKIAHCLRVSDDTITNYIKLYRDKGLGGLIENRYYKPVSSVEPYLEEITAAFASEPVGSTSEAAARIESLTDIRLSDSQPGRIMKRLGMKYQKSAAVPGKADPQLQFDFLNEELLPRLEEAQKGE